MKEIIMQPTIDYMYRLDPLLLERIFKGRTYEKKVIDENDITYFIIKDE